MVRFLSTVGMLFGLVAAGSVALAANNFVVWSVAALTGLASLLVGIGAYLVSKKPRLGQALLWLGALGLIFPGGLTILFPYLILPAIACSLLAAWLNHST